MTTEDASKQIQNLNLGSEPLKYATQTPVSGFPACAPSARTAVPKHNFPEGCLTKEAVSELISDELTLEGRPRLNLATFVTTRMEKEAEALMMRGATRNFIDADEYNKTSEMGQRCVNMIADLYHAPTPAGEDATGTSCVGSSEAIMLAVLNMKWMWRQFRQDKGLEATKPNIIFGSNVQVCWHKACRYFEVEERIAPVSKEALVLTKEAALPLIDENTIGVCPILGSTYNGEYEDIKGIHDMVVELNKKNGWNIPLHVDGASGGFVAPFTHPQLEWDFRLPNVKSINVSGHKFGLVYAGVGWLVFREKADLHPHLVFHVNYLGGDQAHFSLNFSKGSGNIIGQYYNFLRLGRVGYTQIMTNCLANAEHLRQKLLSTGKVRIVDKAHVPLVAWAITDEKYTVFDIQDLLRTKGWIVPAYTCSKGAEDLAIMRVVVKPDFTRDLADMLFDDIVTAMNWLEEHPTRHAEITPAIREKIEKRHHLKDVAKAVVAGGRLKELAELTKLTKSDILTIAHDPSHRASGEKTKAIC